MNTVRPRFSKHLLPVAAVAAISACGGGDDAAPPITETGQITARQACTNLEGKSVGNATVTTAEVVPATAAAPTYCKVTALIAPKLNMELRLPDKWNGKFVYSGGGGYNGVILGVNVAVLMAGYANVASDSGHRGNGLDGSFALNDPHAAYLFGSGSVPTVAAAAKDMLQVAYNKAPEYSYFEGCSNGGREGLMAAQRNPKLFDGIIARAPAYNWTGLFGHFHLNSQAVAAPGAGIPPAKVSLVAKAVREACDAKDGIVDGVVSNLAACNFDLSVLRCVGGADTGTSCLSDTQLTAIARRTGPVSFDGGAYTNPGWMLTGNEDSMQGSGAWVAWFTGVNGDGGGALGTIFQDTTIKNYLALDANANSSNYVWDSNLTSLRAMAALNDATDADLGPFKNNGGKLILWHGGNDSAISFKGTTEYYNRVGHAVGGRSSLDAFARYYVAPGVNHCAGGPGADVTDLLTPLDAWVTKGTAPETLVTSKLNTDGTTAFARPLCVYPQYPRYIGRDNDAEAAKLAENYTCTGP